MGEERTLSRRDVLRAGLGAVGGAVLGAGYYSVKGGASETPAPAGGRNEKRPDSISPEKQGPSFVECVAGGAVTGAGVAVVAGRVASGRNSALETERRRAHEEGRRWEWEQDRHRRNTDDDNRGL